MITKKRLADINNDTLAEQAGVVYQVWEDGEITLTKSGSLLGQRGLHCVTWGLDKQVNPELFPHQYNGHGFCYVTESGAALIRQLVKQYGS